jgi:hypothetical protein
VDVQLAVLRTRLPDRQITCDLTRRRQGTHRPQRLRRGLWRAPAEAFLPTCH